MEDKITDPLARQAARQKRIGDESQVMSEDAIRRQRIMVEREDRR